jgi:hypothetical protein
MLGDVEQFFGWGWGGDFRHEEYDLHDDSSGRVNWKLNPKFGIFYRSVFLELLRG